MRRNNRPAYAVRPWTLRDLRRALHRFLIEADGHLVSMAANGKPGFVLKALGLYKFYPGPKTLAEIDRLISRYGPDHVVWPVARPEADRTNHHAEDVMEDALGVDEDAAVHGGDGNSGDMDHPAQTAAESREGGDHEEGASPQGEGSEPNDQPNPQGDQDGAAKDCQCECPCGHAPGGQQTGGSSAAQAACEARSGEGEDGADEATEGMGSHADHQPSSGDNSCAGNAAPAEAAAEDDGTADNSGEEPAQGLTGERDTGSRASRNGGAGREVGSPRPTLSEAAMQIAVSRIERALRRLADRIGRRSVSPTPRWDARALTRELVSRRYALHRARETQRSTQGVLLMPDLSGSCYWVSGLTMPLAERVAERAQLAVAPTPPTAWEGVVADVAGHRDMAERIRRVIDRAGPVSTVDGWRALLAAGVTHILVLGDVHGHASYEAARDAGVKVIWVDPNWDHMPVTDTRGMAYEPIREATPKGVAEAIERAVARV